MKSFVKADSLAGILVAFATVTLGFPSLAAAEEPAPSQSAQVQTGAGLRPWGREKNANVRQADAWFENYKFRGGETLRSATRIATPTETSTMRSWSCTGREPMVWRSSAQLI